MSVNKEDVLNLLKTYAFSDKFRLGSNQDGGYVIANLKDIKYDCYISAGISNEESFSRDFINKYKMTKENSFGFDGTIVNYPYSYTKNITFIKKNISNTNNDIYTDLVYLLKNYKNIFLKMDIEGGEYPWLLSLNIEYLKNISQITIELHGIMDDSYGCLLSDKLKCLNKLAETHYNVHAHGNNWSNIIDRIPNVIELTYVNKTYFQPKLNTINLPMVNLDYPNNINAPDIQLNMYPFVDKINNLEYGWYSKLKRMELIFTNIYESNKWGNNNNREYSGSSGPGSDINYNKDNYVPFLKKFISDNNIKNIVDLGCGDFKCGKILYDDLDIIYTGYDAYEKVIMYNSKEYSLPKYSFKHLDFYTYKETIVNGDLCILKDILQHWSLDTIYSFLDYLVENKKFKYILIINCCNQVKDNVDCKVGETRELSCKYFPLKNYNATKLLNYYTKEISVIKL